MKDNLGWLIANNTFDFFFLIDIILNFNTAYYDEDFAIIEDRCEIAKSYLTGWFIIDVLAIFPFDVLMNANQMNGMVRLTRLSRLYKVIKLLRLVRIFKLQKSGKRKLKGDTHE